MGKVVTSDVVVIGAGIIGCSAAYYLARAGLQVTIIEKDSVGSHASGYALGGLNPLSGIGVPQPLGSLAMEGFRTILNLPNQLHEETGVKLNLQLITAITVAFKEADAKLLKQRLPWQQKQLELRSELMGTKEILELEPRLSDQVLGGVVTEGVGLLDPYNLCSSLLESAVKKGLTTIRHGAVRGLKFRGNRVEAVQLDGEDITCNAVVIAMGPWTSEAAKWTGTEFPVRPLKGEILRLRTSGPPFSYISSANSYIVTKPDGLVWAGTTEEEAGFNEDPSQVARQTIMDNVVHAFPTLKEAEIVQQTACLRPVTADGLPILGKVCGSEGVIVATGAGRKGILLGPIMGMAAADLVTRNVTRYEFLALQPNRSTNPDQHSSAHVGPLRF